MFKGLYKDLYDHYGDLGWWPSENDDETIIGCMLTQNTSWKNVEKSIKNLKENNIKTLNDIVKLDENNLKNLIKSSGFYNVKGKYLMNVSKSIIGKYGNVNNMKNKNVDEILKFIINLNGIGNETMESIMLYALDYHIFVVDSYTLRFLKRYLNMDLKRSELRKITEDEFEDNYELKNLHGMIVEISKDYCRKKPLCNKCFLNKKCVYYSINR